MGTPETSREPCPDRILDDLGGAFAMGAIGGSVFHFFRGTINSPRGEKFRGGLQTLRMNAPKTGGGFAAWGGLFSTFDCGMVYIRQKEDPWNSIVAGAATGGFLQMRQGVRAAARSAAFGGVLLGMIEGAMIMLNRISAPPQQYEDPNAVMMPAPPPGYPGYQYPGYGVPGHQQVGGGGGSGSGEEVQQGGGGWFGGLFGGGKKEEVGSSSGSGSGSSGSETKVLESFDTPTAMPSFDYK